MRNIISFSELKLLLRLLANNFNTIGKLELYSFRGEVFSFTHCFSNLVNLVGDLGCGLVVPGDEGAVCRVSAHAV